MSLNKIMVVIDPTAERQPAFERALDSARLSGASLHLCACIHEESECTDLQHAQQQPQPVLEALAAINPASPDGAHERH
jgi:hypothetical protein